MKRVSFADCVTENSFEPEEGPTILLLDTELFCLGYHARESDENVMTKIHDGPNQGHALVHNVIMLFRKKRKISRDQVAHMLGGADHVTKQQALASLRMLHRQIVEKGYAHVLPSRTRLASEWRYALCFIAAAMSHA